MSSKVVHKKKKRKKKQTKFKGRALHWPNYQIIFITNPVFFLLPTDLNVNAQNRGTHWTPLHAATFQEHGPVGYILSGLFLGFNLEYAYHYLCQQCHEPSTWFCINT